MGVPESPKTKNTHNTPRIALYCTIFYPLFSVGSSKGATFYRVRCNGKGGQGQGAYYSTKRLFYSKDMRGVLLLGTMGNGIDMIPFYVVSTCQKRETVEAHVNINFCG